MSYTTPSTHVAGTALTAARLNTDLRDNVAWLATDSPSCRVYNNANISVPDVTWTSLTFNSERFDNSAIHSTGANTERLTIPAGGGGKYLVGGGVSWAVSGAGSYRSSRIGVNSTPTVVAWCAMDPSAVHGSETTPVTTYSMSAADYFVLQAIQNSGGALNSTVVANYAPEFWCHWIRT